MLGSMSEDRFDWLAGGDRRAMAVEKIHAAAGELFLERGIDRVTVADVAARAGCSRATLYRCVGGKSELLDAVLSEAAVKVAQRVQKSVEPYEGRRRVVEAILAALAAIRADPTLAHWFRVTRSGAADEYLAGAPQLGRISSALTGLASDDESSQWIVRVVLSLLAWPLPDTAAERRLVERYATAAFV